MCDPKSLYHHLCVDDMGFLNTTLCLHTDPLFISISILQHCLRRRFNTQIEYTTFWEEKKMQIHHTAYQYKEKKRCNQQVPQHDEGLCDILTSLRRSCVPSYSIPYRRSNPFKILGGDQVSHTVCRLTFLAVTFTTVSGAGREEQNILIMIMTQINLIGFCLEIAGLCQHSCVSVCQVDKRSDDGGTHITCPLSIIVAQQTVFN